MSLNQSLRDLHNMYPLTDQTMPVLFVGHGNPMNALEENPFSKAWETIGKDIPRPRAILCISAHWETLGTQVTGMDHPRTIHDFGGFPRKLYEVQYPAPGSPELARLLQTTVQKTLVKLDSNWGLDHGTWSVLCRMFPVADIAVVQLSLDHTQKPEYHYALAKELAGLRKRGVLVVGSGNIVHNLGLVAFEDKGYDWAIEFDETAKRLIQSGDFDALVHYENLGRAAKLAIPTEEHYLPLLYALALKDEKDTVRFFADQITMGSLSMRSLLIG
jgi:4,5-DOPA dioxygenase extradiol